jgi:hypothetical protein
MKHLVGILIGLGLLAFVATPAFAEGPRDRVCFGGSTLVRLDETVQSVVLFGCGARVQSGAQVQRDVVSFGGDVVLEENVRVGNDVVVFGGDVQIAGQVSDEVVVFGGRVTLEPTAVVERNVLIMGGFLDKKEGAVVRGNIERNTDFSAPRPGWNWGLPMFAPFSTSWNLWDNVFYGFFKNLINTLALAALGALILVFLPAQLNQVAVVAQKSAAPSLGVGCLTWLVVPPLMILFIVTCLGIPLSLVLGIAFVAAIVLGWIAISVVIGDKVLNALKAKNILPMVAMLFGVLALWLITSLPILGALIWLFIATLAVGAVVLTRFGTRPYPLTVSALVAPGLPVVPGAPPAPPPSSDANT